jgi:hypothetical protein
VSSVILFDLVGTLPAHVENVGYVFTTIGISCGRGGSSSAHNTGGPGPSNPVTRQFPLKN